MSNISYELFVSRIFNESVELKKRPVCLSSVNSDAIENIVRLRDGNHLERIL